MKLLGGVLTWRRWVKVRIWRCGVSVRKLRMGLSKHWEAWMAVHKHLLLLVKVLLMRSSVLHWRDTMSSILLCSISLSLAVWASCHIDIYLERLVTLSCVMHNIKLRFYVFIHLEVALLLLRVLGLISAIDVAFSHITALGFKQMLLVSFLDFGAHYTLFLALPVVCLSSFLSLSIWILRLYVVRTSVPLLSLHYWELGVALRIIYTLLLKWVLTVQYS